MLARESTVLVAANPDDGVATTNYRERGSRKHDSPERQ